MSRVAGVALLVVAALGAQNAAGAALASLPATWTHEVSETCQWRIKPWAASLGADPAPLADDMRWECLERRGQKSRTRVLKEIAAKWPSEAEFTAWEQADADDHSFQAGDGARKLP